MKLSIVTTLYRSALTVSEFYRRASETAKEFAGSDYEIIMVNDGSPDNCLEIAAELTKKDSHLTVVDLSRNFGQHRAMLTGIRFAKGDLVFALDDDLEESPEWLPKFYQRMEETGADHVYGVQESRKGGWFERWSGSAFYTVFNWLSDIKITPNQIMAKLMTRRFVNALLEYEERNCFLAGILALTGFVQQPLICVKTSKGRTSYTFTRKVEQSVNSITSFSSRPLYIIFYFGIFISIISLLFLAYLILKKLIVGTVLMGWTSIMAVTTFGFGVVISILGVIGIYMSKIFEEVKHRPYVTIKSIIKNM